MNLRCVSKYSSTFKFRTVVFEPGDPVPNDDPELQAHLLKDSPKSFEIVQAEPKVEAATKPVDVAPADKMVRPEAKKAVRATK